MPIPDQHLAQLKVDLQTHEKRILLLKELQTAIESEIAAHEKRILSLKELLTDVESETTCHMIIIKLGQDPQVLAAVEEIHNEPKLVNDIQSNPDTFIRSRGIQLPSHATITAGRLGPQSTVVHVDFQIGRIQARVQWDTDNGFTAQEIR